MKRIEELGISPAPWESHNQFVTANDDGSVVAATNFRDASLIAAAPELYEALMPFVPLTDWMLTNAAKLGILDMVKRLREHGDRARAALAKAAGEGEVRNA